MKPKRIFLFKPALLLLIVGLLQLLIGAYFPEKSFKNLDLLKKYLKHPVDLLYFGDSTIWYTGGKDKDRRSIDRMLRHSLRGYRVKSITHAAYQLEVYAAFCQYIVKQKKEKHPRVIIFPINMRSFSLEWDRNPRYQFEKEKIILEGGVRLVFYKPLRVLKYKFNKINRKEYLSTPVFFGNREKGTIKEMKGIKNQFILRYMYTLTREHRKIKSLETAVELLSRHNIKFLFYITPIDYRSGERHLPGKFTKQLSRNVAFVRSLLREKGHHLLDFSQDLTSDYFAWRRRHKGLPNEHLNQEGRRYVAEKIAEQLRTSLFINTLKKHTKKTNFLAVPNGVSRHGGILTAGVTRCLKIETRGKR